MNKSINLTGTYDVDFVCEYNDRTEEYIYPKKKEIKEEVKSVLEFILDELEIDYTEIKKFKYEIIDEFWDGDLLEYKVEFQNPVVIIN